MTPILVDSCVILDIVTEDSDWFDWSASTLEKHANSSELLINPLIYSEISIGYHGIEELDAILVDAYFKKIPLPWEAAFLAGKAFIKYRRAGGQRALPLPDFFIGAHAAVSGLKLMTRDVKRFRNYYPTLNIISP